MPEHATRVVLKGIRKAERDFALAVRRRVEAERTVPGLERDLRDLKRETEQLEREMGRGV